MPPSEEERRKISRKGTYVSKGKSSARCNRGVCGGCVCGLGGREVCI